MKRSGLKRRTPLKAKTGLKRSAPLKATGAPRAGKAKARIVPVRPATRSRNQEYAALTAVWLGERGTVSCEGWARGGWPAWARGRCTGWATEVHHGMGRGRYQMLDVGTWLALCRGCHQWATDHPADAKKVGLSWPRNGEVPSMAGKLYSTCKGCRAPIFWAWTGEKSIPLIADPETKEPRAFDPEPHERRGRIQEEMREANLLGELERVCVRMLGVDDDGDPGKPFWRSHFADCPAAKKFRR